MENFSGVDAFNLPFRPARISSNQSRCCRRCVERSCTPQLTLPCCSALPSTRGQLGLDRRQRNGSLAAWTIKPLAMVLLRLRENRSDARSRVRRKRHGGRRSANGASKQSPRLKERLNKPGRSTKPEPKRLKGTALHSTDDRKLRMRTGRSRKRNWKPLCAGRVTSSKRTAKARTAAHVFLW